MTKNAQSERTSTGTNSDRPNSDLTAHAVQLRLLPGRAGRRDWALDERTRTVGRMGVAQAREILRKHRPPQPVDAYTRAS